MVARCGCPRTAARGGGPACAVPEQSWTKGTVTAVELEDSDGGTPTWSVDVVTTDDWNKTTFDIDATDGKILREHVDRD
ncbi:PepSY domain-containing protein [Streptomyces sp. 5-8]|uniref:PepSY domain-containing protein n=1 Tax=Streptomyces musisoli TaxID=2802280 RepID=A0ABS1NW23_9ACTN|nr:PepSY domain-containing protein [Streptomyces musisoli]MBY8844455.1 PepSY domain-containing protein [Streptomyces sp. SP2-10]